MVRWARESGRRSFAVAALAAIAALILPATQARAAQCDVPSVAHPTIDDALMDPSCDPIVLGATTFNEDLSITRDVTIRGQGSAATTIDGTGVTGTVNDSGAPAQTWTLEDVTVTGGLTGVDVTQGDTATLDGVVVDGNAGRGLDVSGSSTVNLVDSTVSDNTTSLSGAGIFVGMATVNLDGSTVSGNETTGSGGGGIHVLSTGTATVERSTITANKANAATQHGGGIETEGTLTISDSLISGNQALGTSGFGAGIRALNPVEISNTTITGNQATNHGGGVYAQAEIDLSNSTITGNSVNSATGAGLAIAGGDINLENTIVSGNMRGLVVDNCDEPGVSGDFVTLGHNIDSEANDDCGLADGVNGDQTGTDPALAALADNGGPTMTMAIAESSPAFGAGGGACEVSDQRGAPRSSPACDVGAYEHVECQGETVNVVGTDDDDTISGSPGTDVVLALGGDDEVSGEGGADVLCGGDGEDELDGGAGADELDGGENADELDGGDGGDTLKGRDGKDTLKGEGSTDTLRGGDDGDTLKGGDKGDTLKGEGGKDTLKGEDGDDNLKGGDKGDELKGGNGADDLDGEGGRDDCSGGRGRDTLKSC